MTFGDALAVFESRVKANPALKPYGHLRNEHSQQMAQKVTFSAEPEK